MSISYRTRQRSKRFFSTIVVLAAIILFVLLCWVFWLDRFIVYERSHGARLDFSHKAPTGKGEFLSPTQRPTVPLLSYEQENPEIPDEPVVEVTKGDLSGYHIDFNDIKNDIDAVKAKVDVLPAGTAVLLDVKHPLGYFYYPTALGNTYESQIAPAVFGEFVSHLTARDLHVIARLPAFQDRYFGVNNIPHGISYKGGGGALWLDNENCFWLKPNSELVRQYLVSITNELKSLGFDEVVFTDFCLPDDDDIIFNDDPVQALSDAAKLLVETCADEHFWVSFTGDAAFPLPDGNARLYLEGVIAANVQTVVEQIAIPNPEKHILFYATGHDTRYDKYCVLRPLGFAQ